MSKCNASIRVKTTKTKHIKDIRKYKTFSFSKIFKDFTKNIY